MPYEPLETMITTGAARLDRDGALTSSGEYVAALYESCAADCEWVEGLYGTSGDRMSDYPHIADELTQGLWTRDVESVQGEFAG